MNLFAFIIKSIEIYQIIVDELKIMFDLKIGLRPTLPLLESPLKVSEKVKGTSRIYNGTVNLHKQQKKRVNHIEETES